MLSNTSLNQILDDFEFPLLLEGTASIEVSFEVSMANQSEWSFSAKGGASDAEPTPAEYEQHHWES